jgi:hypothetical protein
VIIQLGKDADPARRIALLQWVVTRLIEALRESPTPVTIRIETDDE